MSEQHQEAHDRVVDVSLTGAFVETQRPPAVGVSVWIVLRSHEGVEVPLHGRVVSVVQATSRHAQGVGIAFDTPPVEVARQLAELVDGLHAQETKVDDVPVISPPPLPPPHELARVVSWLVQENGRLLQRLTELEHENARLRVPPLPLDLP